jgi:hypothetical protein
LKFSSKSLVALEESTRRPRFVSSHAIPSGPTRQRLWLDSPGYKTFLFFSVFSGIPENALNWQNQ